jgi:hypothetical protein
MAMVVVNLYDLRQSYPDLVTNRRALVLMALTLPMWPDRNPRTGVPGHTWVGNVGQLCLNCGWAPTASNRAHVSADVTALAKAGVVRRVQTPAGPGVQLLPAWWPDARGK